jgi:hypothetical protein
MTRILDRPASEQVPQMRAVLVGAGAYPLAQAPSVKAPAFANLTSVAPGVLAIARKLIREWDPMLAAPLVSVDLLLSDPASPGGVQWTGPGVEGEAAAGTPIEGATLAALDSAVTASLAGAKASDHFLFLCCGHGFWKGGRYFVLSDFDSGAKDPWKSVVALDDFKLGLQTEAPRTQWLYFDCCADVPAKSLETFGGIGAPIIQGTPSSIRAAEEAYGKIAQFGYASARLGRQAFGLPNAPSRFCEMLLEALDGAGAVEKRAADGSWWITERGIVDAMSSYAKRNPALDTPKKRRFYEEAGTPMMPDATDGRMLFRRVPAAPKSVLIATSAPATAIKESALAITWEGEDDPCWTQVPPGPQSRLMIPLQPRRTYRVAATYGGLERQIEIFTHLPLADPADFSYE